MLNLNKKYFLISITIFLVIGVLTYLYALDDELYPQAAEWIAEVDQQPEIENNAYVYALGVHTPVGEDPYVLARKRIETYLLYLDTGNLLSPDEDDVTDYEPELSLELPSQEANCSLQNDDCREKWFFASIDEIDEHVAKHSELIKRYEEYLLIDASQRLGKPTVAHPIPEYSYLIAGQRLKQLALIKQGMEGTVLSEARLLEELELIRSRLVRADTLIEKMIFTAMVRSSIEFLAITAQKEYLMPESSIVPLKKEELSMSESWKFEFGFISSLMPELMRTQEDLIEDNWIPNFIIRFFIKPNRSVNENFTYFNSLIQIDNLDPEEYIEASKAIYEEDQKRRFDWKNPLGSILNNISRPMFSKYKERLFVLDTKIELYDQLISDQSYKSSWTDATINPFDESQTAMKKENKVCFETPFDDQKGDGCLVVLSADEKSQRPE